MVGRTKTCEGLEGLEELGGLPRGARTRTNPQAPAPLSGAYQANFHRIAAFGLLWFGMPNTPSEPGLFFSTPNGRNLNRRKA